MTARRIEVVADVAAFAETAATLVAEHAEKAIAARGRFVFALTGGSTPIPLHEALARAPIRDRIDWTKVFVVFGDERAVAPTAKESNYGSAQRTLLGKVPLPEANVLRMEADRPDLASVARAYEDRLLALCDGRVDLVCVGIGKDAHVFSLFPGSPAIDEAHRLVVAEIDPPMNPALSRITFTPRMIDRAGAVLAIATGAEKSAAVAHALAGVDQAHRFPARLLARAPETIWVLDRAAAAELPR